MLINIINVLCKVIKSDINISKYYTKQYQNSKYSLVCILTDIIYVLKSGVSWRNLRSNINYRTIYYHFQRFVKNNIFYKTFSYIRDKYLEIKQQSNISIIDTSFIQNKFGKNKITRNKFFKNKNCNKISLIIDSNKFPLSILIDSGSKHDIKFMSEHFNDFDVLYYYSKKTIKRTLLADKAYESKDLRNQLVEKYNTDLMIPSKINSNIYKKRIFIEHTFAYIKQYKRINMRFDSNFNTFSNFIFLAIVFNAELCILIHP